MAEIAILGLSGPGAVLGRTLKSSLRGAAITGYDPDGKTAKAAVESGAVDETKRSIPEAIVGAQIIVVAAPMDVAESAMQVLGQSAPAGCVVTDLCRLKAPVMAWAERYIPPGVGFVGGHAILREGDSLEGATYCVVPRPSAQPDAFEAVTGLAKAVGALPYFVDAMEHDSFMVATHYLPAIAAGLAVDAALDGPSWPDVRRLWGEAFENAIETADVDPFELSLLLSMEPSPVGAWLDKLSRQLVVMQGLVEGPQRQGGAAQVIQAMLDQRGGNLTRAVGIEQPRVERQSASSLLFGDWLATRRRRS
jgi:prephenate dehydrogenase